MTITSAWHGVSRRALRARRHRIARRSLLTAYATFANRHPRWTQSLFDRYLLEFKIAPLLEESLGNGSKLTARTLATAWAGQLTRDEDDRRRLAAGAMSISKEFLELLEAQGGTGPGIGSGLPSFRVAVYFNGRKSAPF